MAFLYAHNIFTCQPKGGGGTPPPPVDPPLHATPFFFNSINVFNIIIYKETTSKHTTSIQLQEQQRISTNIVREMKIKHLEDNRLHEHIRHMYLTIFWCKHLHIIMLLHFRGAQGMFVGIITSRGWYRNLLHNRGPSFLVQIEPLNKRTPFSPFSCYRHFDFRRVLFHPLHKKTELPTIKHAFFWGGVRFCKFRKQ